MHFNLIWCTCRNHLLSLQKPFTIPAETTVPLHKPKNVPTVLCYGKTKNSVYAGTKYEIVQGQILYKELDSIINWFIFYIIWIYF